MVGAKAVGATMRTSRALSDLATLYDGGTSAGQSDEQLLDRYARRGDPSAFEALVVRHGPLVLGYCRRSLRDDHAADDAFQATFLVLARRAGAVRADGSLGRWLAGLTTREAKEKLILNLRAYLKDEDLGLVEDGRAIEPARSRRLAVDVSAYNSKFYYVQGSVAQPGRFHVTGNETVLDAITLAGGLLPGVGSHNVRLVRPAPTGAGREQVLPVNLAAIVVAGDTTTNYQLIPGDRLIVYGDPPAAAADPAVAQPATDPAATEADPPARASQLRELERKLDRILERLDSTPTAKPPLELEPSNSLKR